MNLGKTQGQVINTLGEVGSGETRGGSGTLDEPREVRIWKLVGPMLCTTLGIVKSVQLSLIDETKEVEQRLNLKKNGTMHKHNEVGPILIGS
jgi:hypothetical protein